MLKIFLCRFVFIVSGIFLLFTAYVYAGDSPTVGMVYNTKERNFLIYSCSEGQDHSLDCEFTQTRVTKKLTADDVKTRLNEARKGFPTSTDLAPESCKVYRDMFEVLRGHKRAPNKQGQDFSKNMSNMERKDMLKITSAMITACNSKTEENYLNAIRAMLDKDTRTCVISSYNFKQSFHLVLDNFSGARSWVAKGDPHGPCGIVQLSRFEPDKLKGSELVVWKYIAKKAITNRQGLAMPGIACKDLDENEYIFDWKPKTPHAVNCDYIEFSPL